MYKHPYLTAAATAAFLALSACNNEPEIVNSSVDSQAAELANAAPVQLPPAITDNRTYRCAPDNSLIYVDFYDNNSAMIRTTPDGMPTQLTQTGGTGAYTGSGQSVSANATRATINGKSCHT